MKRYIEHNVDYDHQKDPVSDQYIQFIFQRKAFKGRNILQMNIGLTYPAKGTTPEEPFFEQFDRQFYEISEVKWNQFARGFSTTIPKKAKK
jgi:hypothetical protein